MAIASEGAGPDESHNTRRELLRFPRTVVERVVVDFIIVEVTEKVPLTFVVLT